MGDEKLAVSSVVAWRPDGDGMRGVGHVRGGKCGCHNREAEGYLVEGHRGGKQMTEKTRVKIRYSRIGRGQGLYHVEVLRPDGLIGDDFVKWTVRGVKTTFTDRKLKAGKRLTAACREARETGRAEFEI